MKNIFANLVILLSAAVLSVACHDDLGDNNNGGSGKYVDYSDGNRHTVGICLNRPAILKDELELSI